MPLDQYARKRDFRKTPEPSGADPRTGAAPASRDGAAERGARGGRFVVQRHRATRLHYDFRLEVDGVLVSWAVPKGPTLDPGDRRMAVHVEDHPIEYLDFEGVIPKGEYGGGDVIVWDWGTWTPEAETPDPGPAIANGELKFALRGEKLRGRFTIVRTSRRPGRAPSTPFEDDQGEQWLLIHKRDEHAVEGWDPEEHPRSVKTGRTNDEVKEARDAIWISQAPAATAEIDLSKAIEAPMPSFIPPMAATLADKGFTDEDWLFEVKWDGYRLETVVRDGSVRTYTRNGKDGETYFPRLLTPPTWIDAREAIVDGEVVALDEHGMPEFALLQELTGTQDRRLVYQVFDLLHLDGKSLLRVPLEDRKALLRLVLRDGDRRVRFADHVVREGAVFLDAASKQGLEGVIAKHRRSVYEPGVRSKAWLKLKHRPEQELVVGGWTPGEGNAKDLGALVVGVYEDDEGVRRLRFAGKVGSGFNAASRKRMRERLEALAQPDPAFDPPPPTNYKGRWGGDLAGVSWVRPEVVIRAELGGWTRDDLVRQAAFKGLDEGGKPPTDVVRERPVPTRSTIEAVERLMPGEAERPGEESPNARSRSSDSARRNEPSSAMPLGTSIPPRASGTTSSATKASATKGSATKASATKASETRSGSTGSGMKASRAKVSGRSESRRGRGAPAGNGAVDHEYAWSATPRELATLDAMKGDGAWSVGGFELKVTNLDKVLFAAREPSSSEGGPGAPAEPPVTKRDLIRYFVQIGPTILPHLAERPLNLHRYPNGADHPGFWQKNVPDSAPSWLRRWEEVGVTDRGTNLHLVADRVASLAWLANSAAFEIHAWTTTVADPLEPTFALIDIDPGEATTWEETLTLARLYRTALEHLGVRGYPKTTGRRGIQVWVPVTRGRYSYADTSAWVEGLSRAIGQIVPDLVSWEWAKGDRKGRARLDYTQNAPNKTLVAPYAVRPKAAAPVSAPIAWEEIDDPDLRSDRWTIRTVLDRVARVGDLFAPAQTDAQDLPKL